MFVNTSNVFEFYLSAEGTANWSFKPQIFICQIGGYGEKEGGGQLSVD